jgi:hypothetical protein
MKTTLIFLMTLLLTTVGCTKDEHKDKQQHDCGCESEALSTVSTVGEIYFKTQVEPDDDYYNDNFWIIEKIPGSIENHYVVCNEEITKNEFDELKSSGNKIKVNFTRHRGI